MSRTTTKSKITLEVEVSGTNLLALGVALKVLGHRLCVNKYPQHLTEGIVAPGFLGEDEVRYKIIKWED